MRIAQRIQQALLTGTGIALLLLLIWWLNLFASAQLSLTNVYFVPQPTSEQIVIVAIDNDSLNAYGRSITQWSRSVYADLVTALNQANARVIAFDIIFSEPSEQDETFVNAMLDAQRSEQRTRVVMPRIGLPAGDFQTTLEAYPNAIGYTTTLEPIPAFAQTVNYTGFANAFNDVDGVIRRQASIIEAPDNTATVSFSLATYLAYLRLPAQFISQVVTYEDGTLQVAERQLPVDERGFWLQNYYGSPAILSNTTFPVVSLVDVINGEVDAALFDDKIVLIGEIFSSGATDQYPVPSSPSGTPMAGVEIQANAIETLIQNEAIRTPTPLTQVALIVVLSIGSSLIYAYPRWYFKLILWLLLMGVSLIAAFVLFNTQHVMLGLLHPALALTLPVVMTIGFDITREIQLRRRSDFLLESVVEVSEQRLQIGNMLPLIAADIQRLVPQSSGMLWIAGDDGRHTTRYEWTHENNPMPPLAPLMETAIQTHTPNHQEQLLALPVVWQGRVLSVFGIATARPRLENRAILLLQDLVNRLAPSFENAILYTQVQRQRNTLETVLENSPSAIIVLDEQQKVILNNAVSDELSEIEQEEPLLGMMFADWLKQFDAEEKVYQKITRSLQQEEPLRTEIDIANRTYILEAAPLELTSGWVIVLSDVTEIAELNRLKTRMIRMASHDLKNPLGRVIGYAELILDMDNETLEPQNVRFLNHIQEAAVEMEQIITEILNLEQLRSRGLNREKLDFGQLVRQVAGRHEPDATRKQQTFTLALPDEALFVHGDAQQLSQGVSNFIGNAIKYTPDGGTIIVRLLQDNMMVRFEVQDDGVGISEEAQKKLFTEFYRVKTEATAHIPGTGLGLSLVKSVIEAHEGQVGVISMAGEGSTFWAELPVYHDEEVMA